ncbi:hypothetical protein [Paractinoplanes atraurantiacus]|uniref:Uncharacterized protein n=1 Tax=Paractinoplanes atraurantiacus TaxID=1036182 RepID=A0A285J1L2_9ACTN|nr:hypothetical protein [Actinoplanes atraurantiacus]SNY54144.1 hypothetical protein SAMN05421748_1155 [Actinoplanes atraurantiacus]
MPSREILGHRLPLLGIDRPGPDTVMLDYSAPGEPTVAYIGFVSDEEYEEG